VLLGDHHFQRLDDRQRIVAPSELQRTHGVGCDRSSRRVALRLKRFSPAPVGTMLYRGPVDLRPCRDRAPATRPDAGIYRNRSSERGADWRAFRSNKQSPADAGTHPITRNAEGILEAPPGFEPGWRFCRFSGVGHGVVSCWSLVGPAPPFYLVFGPYWTTFGLRRPVTLVRGGPPAAS
jgi:hypothetical protein